MLFLTEGGSIMFSQEVFGKRLRELRMQRGLTQKETAAQIDVSVQALSKWENGSCLPDVYYLALLTKVLHVSADALLADENTGMERIVETIHLGEAVFEVVEKPEMILAGRMIYARDYEDMPAFDAAIESVREVEVYAKLTDVVLPIHDIRLSVNFWREESLRAYGFMREVTTERQPEGVDVYRVPASMYIRSYTDSATAKLMLKDQCETWELFAYIRNYLMPAHGFRMAENGAQELEVFDTSGHTTGCVYMPVMRG